MRCTSIFMALLFAVFVQHSRGEEASSSRSAGESESTRAAKTKGCACCSDDAPLKSLVESVTPWRKPDERREIKTLDINVTDQDGNAMKLKDLLGQPVAIAFFYSRCSNANKCPLAVRTMGKLVENVKSAEMTEKVKLLMITYDPEYDTPAMMKKFGEIQGVTFSDRIKMLRPDPEKKKQLFDELGLSVNFNVTGVSLHGVELLLLDKHAQLVRNYHTLIWKNENVVEDLRKLVSE